MYIYIYIHESALACIVQREYTCKHEAMIEMWSCAVRIRYGVKRLAYAHYTDVH